MKSVELPDEFVTSKAWLIEFLCGYGNNIADKSDEHIACVQNLMNILTK
jgi:hypothetical protein